MGPREFFTKAAPDLGETDSQFVIGPVGTHSGLVTHQFAIRFHSAPNEESVKVFSADTDPDNDGITEATITARNGEVQVGDFQIGPNMGKGEIDFRDVETVLGLSAIRLTEVDPREAAGFYSGTVTDEQSLYHAELSTAKFAGDNEFYIGVDEYTEVMEAHHADLTNF